MEKARQLSLGGEFRNIPHKDVGLYPQIQLVTSPVIEEMVTYMAESPLNKVAIERRFDSFLKAVTAFPAPQTVFQVVSEMHVNQVGGEFLALNGFQTIPLKENFVNSRFRIQRYKTMGNLELEVKDPEKGIFQKVTDLDFFAAFHADHARRILIVESKFASDQQTMKRVHKAANLANLPRRYGAVAAAMDQDEISLCLQLAKEIVPVDDEVLRGFLHAGGIIRRNKVTPQEMREYAYWLFNKKLEMAGGRANVEES